MSPEAPRLGTVRIEPQLLDWLARTAPEPVRAWAPDPPLGELNCHPDLVARLAEIARPVRGTARVFVAGCPVIHAGARPIAAASGTAWLAVRSPLPAGAMHATHAPTEGLAPGWVELDPWAVDVAFARATDLLRAHVVRACESAEAES